MLNKTIKTAILAVVLLSVNQISFAAATDDFVIVVKTENSGTSANNKFIIPTFSGLTYKYAVDCDNDGNDEITSAFGDYTCVYPVGGSYTIRIKDIDGANKHFPRIHFNNSGDKSKIVDVLQWGTNEWTSMESAFYGANSLSISATDAPDFSLVTNMDSMFENAFNVNPNTSNWDVSTVTSMADMFAGVTLSTASYDAILSNFNSQALQSSVNFSGGNSKYCAITARANLISASGHNWNISDGGLDPTCPSPLDDFVITVKTDNPGFSSDLQFFIPAYYSAGNYDYNIDCDNDGIDEATAVQGNYACQYAVAGTYTIRIKDRLGNGTHFPKIDFGNSIDLLKIIDVSQWGTGKWVSMESAFQGATNLQVTATDTPDLSMVVSLSNMFRNTPLANPDTSNWVTTNVTNMSGMFRGTALAIPDTSGWDTVNVTDMSNMFFSANLANPDTSSWVTTNVTNMSSMFASADLANPDTSGWDTTNVTDMSYMFSSADLASPDTSNWITANVTDMSGMFGFAYIANPDTSNWDVSNVTSMNSMFSNVTLPTANYDAMLFGFNAQNPQSGIIFDGGNSKYCATDAHDGLEINHSWTISDGGVSPNCTTPADGFVIKVNTMVLGSTTNLQFEINTDGVNSNYNIDCDDTYPGTNTVIGQVGNYTCNYANPGIYTIRISDNIGNSLGFPFISSQLHDDAKKIVELKQWGTGVWASMSYAFAGAENMLISATDIPDFTNVVNMSHMFSGASLVNPDTSSWVTQNVIDMSYMFSNAAAANPDTSGWDTQNVTDMSNMFENVTLVNPNTSSWDITNVTSMASMFSGVTLPTLDYDAMLTGFDAQNLQFVISFDGGNSQYCDTTVHDNLTSVNGHGWNILDAGIDPTCPGPEVDFVIKVNTNNPGALPNNQFKIQTSPGSTTYDYNVDCNNDGIDEVVGATASYTCTYPTPGTYTIRIKSRLAGDTGFPRIVFFGTEVNKVVELVQWGTSKWTTMDQAFSGASNMVVTATDVPDLSLVTNTHRMFYTASLANPDTSSWNTQNITNMSGMFDGATLANPNTSNWDVSNVTNMSHLFRSTTLANPDISSWITINVTGMREMFFSALSADPDTSSLVTTNVTDMRGMFKNATTANPDTSSWITANVTVMNEMFYGATSANPDTNGWDVSNVTDMSNMFHNVTLPTLDYDAMLIGFSAQNIQSNVPFSGGNSVYCSQLAQLARANLINNHNWTIFDGSACAGANPNIAPSFSITCDIDATDVLQIDPITGNAFISFGNFITNMSVGPVNESIQTYDLFISIESSPDSVMLFSGNSIDTNGLITLGINEQSNGIATMRVTMVDSGGTNNGGDDTTIMLFNVFHFADLAVDPSLPIDIIYKNTFDPCRTN